MIQNIKNYLVKTIAELTATTKEKVTTGKTDGKADILNEKQRVVPEWSTGLDYEPYKKQLVNWADTNKKNPISVYYEALESLKKKD